MRLTAGDVIVVYAAYGLELSNDFADLGVVERNYVKNGFAILVLDAIDDSCQLPVNGPKS